jgi:aspartate carbamoyltransferase catalytic subunit
VPDDLDVLHLPGLAEGVAGRHLDVATRRPFQLSAELLDRLPPQAIVLSPMPVIDEMDERARADGRVRMFDATDLSVAVRADLLQLALRWHDF